MVMPFKTNAILFCVQKRIFIGNAPLFSFHALFAFKFCFYGVQKHKGKLIFMKIDIIHVWQKFLDLYLSITNGIVSYKIYDKRDDFNFEIETFPFLDGDVPHSPSCGVCISQLIRFARVCSNVDDFINRNLFLTSKLLKHGHSYHKIRKAFSKFYHRHS